MKLYYVPFRFCCTRWLWKNIPKISAWEPMCDKPGSARLIYCARRGLKELKSWVKWIRWMKRSCACPYMQCGLIIWLAVRRAWPHLEHTSARVWFMTYVPGTFAREGAMYHTPPSKQRDRCCIRKRAHQLFNLFCLFKMCFRNSFSIYGLIPFFFF